MLSRPNIVMNHGSPAAGRLRPPAIGGEKRSAARSTRLRRYVVFSRSSSHSRRGASASQLSRLLPILGRARRCAALVLRPHVAPAGTGRRHDVKVGGPRTVRFDLHGERQSVLVDLRRRRRGDRGFSFERLAFVTEQQDGRFSTRAEYVPFFSSASLTSKRSAKSEPASTRTVSFSGLLVVVQDRELLVEAVADRAAADHGQLGVDVDGAGARDEEEAGFEVLEIVDRERVQPLPVHASAPTSTGTGCRTRTGRSDR